MKDSENTKLYQFETEDGGFFAVELEEIEESPSANEDYYDEDATRGDDDDEDEKQLKKAQSTFEKALSPLKSAWRSVDKLMGEMAPDEATIEMGVKIGGKAGIPFMVLANKDYHLKVTMTWKKPEKKDPV